MSGRIDLRVLRSLVAAQVRSRHPIGLDWSAAPGLGKFAVMEVAGGGGMSVSDHLAILKIADQDGHAAARTVVSAIVKDAALVVGGDFVEPCTRRALLHIIMSDETRRNARVPTYH